MSNQPRYPCLCCGYLTLPVPGGSYEICPVCFWEADPVQNHDPSFACGANRPSLREARQNYQQFGASERRLLKFVRSPRPEEFPPSADPNPGVRHSPH